MDSRAKFHVYIDGALLYLAQTLSEAWGRVGEHIERGKNASIVICWEKEDDNGK